MLLVWPFWLPFQAAAAASDEKRQTAEIPWEAPPAPGLESAGSMLANDSGAASEYPVHILELNGSRAAFDDETYVGDINLWGFSLALGLNSRYQIGYSYLTNSHIFGDWDPSLDEGPEIAGNEDFDISSTLMYLRRDWQIEGKLGVFALIGYSRLEIETRLKQICFFVCGELIEVTDKGVKYRHKETGIGWGVGIQWQSGRSLAWSLRYVDQSVSGFEFRSVRLDLVFRG